ncbi:MAG: DUF1800 domain-containing protein [Acidobacteria bacterium]|nr:DUF1800 domain-containing protein [Acidobacteriota bacterium]
MTPAQDRPPQRTPRERGTRRGEQSVEHLLRRAGFGASQEEVDFYLELGFSGSVRRLVDYEDAPDDVDSLIGTPGYVAVTAVGGFAPATTIAHARQRWLFRMVHSQRPLQEKMTLFWHNHFATAYTKIAGAFNAAEGSRYMAAKPSEDPNGVKGQIEVFRDFALGNFRDLLVAMAKDVAMLVWLDGRTNVRNRPQENFARELMELFTMGVGTFEESDVYAAARVFTGWNLARPGNAYYTFSYVANQHDTTAKEFTFPIYADGGRTIAARSADAGMQDGLDLINAVARHPATGPRLALKLYRYFVSEVDSPDERLINDLSRLYYENNFEMKPVIRHLLLSSQFTAPAARYARYSWPVEFVTRAIKEVGWAGFSVNDTLTPLANMGQQLFEPPDVNGWDLGAGWFSSGAMVARMNFAATLATNQRFNLRERLRGQARTPEALVTLINDRLTPSPFTSDQHRALVDYAGAGLTFTGSDAQLVTKASGLAHLVVGSGAYQIV